MPRINKKSNAYEKLANHWEKVGHREWAKALNNEGGHHYQIARELMQRCSCTSCC